MLPAERRLDTGHGRSDAAIIQPIPVIARHSDDNKTLGIEWMMGDVDGSEEGCNYQGGNGLVFLNDHEQEIVSLQELRNGVLPYTFTND